MTRTDSCLRLGAATLIFCAGIAAVHAQVPQAGAVSSAQATACKLPTDPGDYCGWGVWAVETQKSVLIASLADSASYLVCRETVDPSEPKGFPLTLEVDGALVTGGAPAAALTVTGTCAIATGKRIVLNGPSRPNRQVRGYYIRLGGLFLANSVPWQLTRGGTAATPDRAVLAQFTLPRPVRVCFGPYIPILQAPGGPAPQPVVKEYQLLLDGGYAQLRTGENAVFNANSCVDVSPRVVGVEPRWGAGDPAVAFGRLAF